MFNNNSFNSQFFNGPPVIHIVLVLDSGEAVELLISDDLVIEVRDFSSPVTRVLELVSHEGLVDDGEFASAVTRVLDITSYLDRTEP